ncbi:hypothetical protein B0H13DRAFT_1929732 [Mycena leptocephala]|nr:hypothetical protein B0H13DRAFT_1929732 [Mycena leptocephala]
MPVFGDPVTIEKRGKFRCLPGVINSGSLGQWSGAGNGWDDWSQRQQVAKCLENMCTTIGGFAQPCLPPSQPREVHQRILYKTCFGVQKVTNSEIEKAPKREWESMGTLSRSGRPKGIKEKQWELCPELDQNDGEERVWSAGWKGLWNSPRTGYGRECELDFILKTPLVFNLRLAPHGLVKRIKNSLAKYPMLTPECDL